METMAGFQTLVVPTGTTFLCAPGMGEVSPAIPAVYHPAELPIDFGSELTRLLELSTRLSEVNETLRNELETSKQNSTELQRMLETSRAELEALKNEFSPLRTHSTELLQTARNSERELDGLRTALRQAGNSLTSLEQSWADYRLAAEQRIARLERGKRWYTGLIIGSLALAAAGWTAFAISR